jgi:MFS family permease
MSADQTPAEKHDPAAAFRHNEYRLFYGTRLCNMFGTNIMMPTLGWQIYKLTHDPLSLGLIGLAVFVPVMLATLPSGQTADRFERRNVYRVFQLVLTTTALIFCGLTVAGVTNPLFFYLAAGLFGASKTFSAPSAAAWMPHLIPRKDLPNAVAWNASGFQLTSVIGPAVAGLTLHLWGEGATYALAAGLYFSGGIGATLIKTRSKGGDRRPVGLAHLLGGLNYIRHNRLILGAVTLDLFAVLLGGAIALLPIYASDILHVGSAGFGFLRSAPAVGAVVTALFLAIRPFRKHVGLWMFAAIAIYGVVTIIFGLSKLYPLSLACLVLLGSADMIGNFIRQSLMQLSMHDDMRGRVSSVNMMFNSASNELGDMESGFVASLVGVVPAVVVGGIGTLIVAGIWAWKFPNLRKIDNLLSIRDESVKDVALAEAIAEDEAFKKSA